MALLRKELSNQSILPKIYFSHLLKLALSLRETINSKTIPGTYMLDNEEAEITVVSLGERKKRKNQLSITVKFFSTNEKIDYKSQAALRLFLEQLRFFFQAHTYHRKMAQVTYENPDPPYAGIQLTSSLIGWLILKQYFEKYHGQMRKL